MGEVIAFFAGAVVGMLTMSTVSVNRKTESEDDEQERYIRNLIRAQAEQIRENPAEYVARKCGIRGDADGHNKGTASGVPE